MGIYFYWDCLKWPLAKETVEENLVVQKLLKNKQLFVLIDHDLQIIKTHKASLLMISTDMIS